MRTPAAEHLIRQRVTALGRALPAASKGDVTSLHQARVATRRLRAALPLVAPGRKAEKLTRSVRRLTQALGPVRELDVALLILDELQDSGDVPRPAIQRLRAAICDERRQLHSELQRRLEDFDVDKLRKRALSAARKGEERAPRRTRDPKRAAEARARARRRAERLAVAIENAAGLYLPDRLHVVRIAVKKLRYTLELEQSVSGSHATARLRTLKTAQDLLGRMHDREVLIARTRSIQGSPGASNLKVSSDLDRLVRRLENECRQLHGHYMALRRDLLSLCHRLIARGDDRGDRARTSAA
jgi:CHAD domain-containing protein